MHGRRRSAALAAFVTGMTMAGVAAAAAPPVPPCAGAPVPAWPPAGAPPAVELWRSADLPEGWAPPACAGLAPPPGALYVALAGSFEHDGDANSLLARLGAVSTHTQMLYWDVGNGAWQPVLVDATALSGRNPKARRADFTPGELHAGARLDVLYDDANPLGPVVYESQIVAADADGFTLVSRNVTAMGLMGISVADPGDISSLLVVHRTAPGVFTQYALSAVKLAAMAAALVPDSMHINRAVGSFRFFAGIPGDRDPPVATN
jgi:hypothetical protein